MAQNLLIITSSCGGGLLQAAVAQEQLARSENKEIKIVKRDLILDWIWKWLSDFCVRSWNSAQRKGDVKSQAFFVFFHRVFDVICWPNVFFHTLRILHRENIDRVIDTQTTATSAIVKAIRLFNHRHTKKVKLEKVVVDLPTKKATHFFKAIKSLSKEDKKYLKLRTIPPLLEENQTADDFWRQHCGLAEEEVHYEDVNVRLAFRKFQGKPREFSPNVFSLQYKNEEELSFLKSAWEKSRVQGQIQQEKKQVSFAIPQNAFVFTVLLGSQPAHAATVGYVKEFMAIAERFPKTPICLFVFCADHTEGKKDLFYDVHAAIAEKKNYPQSLLVVPFSFQTDAAIAPIFHRSNATCSRSGGQTAMELMAVSTGEIWVHSETKKENPSLKDLLKGIPVWESESALYLVNLFGAKLVTPETFTEYAEKLLT